MKRPILSGSIAGLFLIASIVAWDSLARAQQPPVAPQQTQTLSIPIFSPSALLGKIEGLVLTDLQAAEAIAKASGDDIADKCYTALITLVTQMNAAATAPTPAASGSSAPLLPGIVTQFQKARMIINAQRSTSPVFQACSGLKAQIKADGLTAPGQLLSLF